MAEETEVVTPETPAPAAQVTTLQDDAQSVLANLGSFLSDEDRAELEKMTAGAGQQPDAQGQKKADDSGENPEEKAAKEKEIADKAEADKVAKEKEEADKKANEGKKGILGIKKKPAAGATDVVIESPEQVLDFIKSKYGQDIKDIKEMPKFFASVDKMRADAQKFESTNTELETIKREIGSLPPEFFEAFGKITKGESYREVFTKMSPFDMSKGADKQDQKALVNHYFPGKFTDQDFAEKEEDRPETLKIAQEASKIKFEAEKSVYDGNRATVSDNAKKDHEARVQSVSSSVGHLKQRFPDMDDEVFNDVKSTLEGGVQSVLSLFFNPDGTTKPGAAESVLMAKHNKSIMEEMVGATEHLVETKINEDILSRGADTPKPVKNGGSADQIPEELKKQIDEIEKVGSRASRRTF